MRRSLIISVSVLLFVIVAKMQAQNTVYIDSLLIEARNESSDKQKALLYSMVAEEYHFSRPDSAIYFCYVGMYYSELHTDTTDLAYFHNFLGSLYKDIGAYDSSITHFQEAIYWSELNNFDRGVAACKSNLGKTYMLIGDYDKALNSFYSALELFEKHKDTLNIGEVHSNIGNLMIEINEYEAAEEHFRISQNQYQLANAVIQEGWILFDWGNLKYKTGHYNEALQLFYRSLSIWKKYERVRQYQITMLRIGEIFLQKKQYDKALEIFDNAVFVFHTINNPQGESEALMLGGRTHYLLFQYDMAVNKLQQALALSGYIESKQLKLSIYRDLYLCYKAQNVYSDALKYLEKYQALNDTIFSENKEKLIAEYQMKLNLGNKENLIKQLEDSTMRQNLINKNISLQNQRNRMGIYGLVFVVLIIALFLIFVFRRNTRISRLNADLNSALKEREVLIREVHHRVKNNLQIISSLLNLQSEKTQATDPAEVLRISQSRIEAMSMMHENLYKSANLSEISFREYVENLCNYIETSFSLHENGIVLQKNVDDVQVDIDQLVPCGLIINELVTNSIKHAFESDQTEKQINIVCNVNNGLVKMEISDNGKGLPEGFSIAKSKSLGMRLASGLARQLKSSLNIENRKGFYACFEFKTEKS